MAASDAIYPSWSKSLLEAIKAKGPSTQTEATHRTVKEIYKKMVALCKPLQRFRVTTEDGEELVSASQVAPEWAAAGDVIILAEQPLTIGMPPGLSQAEQFAEFEEDLGALYEKISRADKTSNSKAVGAHSKLVVLAIQIKIILECQRQQLRIDQDLRKVQMAFLQVVGLGSFSPLGVSRVAELWSSWCAYRSIMQSRPRLPLSWLPPQRAELCFYAQPWMVIGGTL